MLRARSWAVMLICGMSLAACVDASRINATCRWTDNSSATLDLTRARDREHLRQDAQVAWELGQRFADVRFRTNPREAFPLLSSCRDAMDDSIAARHGISLGAVERARQARVWPIDIVFVFLPMLVLTVLGMLGALREIRRSVDGYAMQRAGAILVAPVIALVATGATQLWAMALETARLRNGHIAGRAFVLPSVAHRGLAFASLCAVTAIVAAISLRGRAAVRE